MVFRREHLQLWNRINEYVYIDLETTGFSYSKGAKIIEIAAYKVKVVNISYTLGSMYRYFTGKEPENAHRAEGDVIMGVEVAKAIQKKIREDYPYIYYHLNK